MSYIHILFATQNGKKIQDTNNKKRNVARGPKRNYRELTALFAVKSVEIFDNWVKRVTQRRCIE